MNSSIIKADNSEFCDMVAEIAHNTMQDKQDGYGYQDQMIMASHILKDDSITEDYKYKILRLRSEIIGYAHKEPTETIPALKNRSVVLFENFVYRKCLAKEFLFQKQDNWD